MALVSAEQRRRELTAAAVQIILDEGPGAVSARKVAQRAGTPLGTVHYAFRDMDQLIEQANIEVLGNIYRAIQDVPTNRGLRAWIADSLHAYWLFLRDDPRHALAFFETYVALFRSGKARTAVIDAQHFLVERMREAEGHDAQPSRLPVTELVHLLMMASDGIALIHFGRQDDKQTPRDIDRIITGLQQLV